MEAELQRGRGLWSCDLLTPDQAGLRPGSLLGPERSGRRAPNRQKSPNINVQKESFQTGGKTG